MLESFDPYCPWWQECWVRAMQEAYAEMIQHLLDAIVHQDDTRR